MTNTLKVKRIRVGGRFPYFTYRLAGMINGRRVREQSTNRGEMDALKQSLEIDAANTEGEITTKNTALSKEQLREAESAFQRLSGKSLSKAVDFFLTSYREPTTDKTLKITVEEYLAEKKMEVRPATYGPMSGELKRFLVGRAEKRPHEITTAEIIDYLKAKRSKKVDPKTKARLPFSPKAWNNVRGYLVALFNWFKLAPRKWVATNPVDDVKQFKIPRHLPVILSVQESINLMQFVQAYRNGVMVPYFAYTLFAGIRPSIKTGEIVRLARHPNFKSLVNFSTGVINITPDIAKGKFVRQMKIAPNLRAWLERYPVKDYPIIPTNYQDMITAIRAKLKLHHDVLRHTRISMHVRKGKSIGETALESGNTETIIKQYYLNLVTDADAELFWDITPDSIQPDSETLAKIEAAIAEIDKRKARGEKEIPADVARQFYEDAETEAWGKAELENTLYERHERQGWRAD